MPQVEIPYPGPEFKQKLLYWAARQDYCVFLDSCDTATDEYGEYDFLIGAATSAKADALTTLSALQESITNDPSHWRFGVFSYDLKSSVEARLSGRHRPASQFPGLCFFRPQWVISKLRGREVLAFDTGFSKEILSEVMATKAENPRLESFSGFASNFSQEEYVSAISQLREHIRQGDCYEINLSQEFSSSIKIEHPAAVWERLRELSPVPFAGYGKWRGIHLLCASPERFLQLRSGRLLTQPIKGTASRGKNEFEDAQFKTRLTSSEKDQAENVMIVDLSRNDLHRSCEPHSVSVPHLFELQTFPQVHHLVSTIQGMKRKDVHPLEAIRNAFPPGSMTGAPKIRTCQLIDQYERSSRGIYSGSLGYFAPGGDFDLNVVIRSVVYDHQARRASYHVGGAITWGSHPESEYQETLLKATAIQRLFADLGGSGAE